MISVQEAYQRLNRRAKKENLIINNGFEINGAYIFSVIDKKGNEGYPFFSVQKSNGIIGGYNPMQNISEYMNAIKNRQLDINSFR